MGDSRSSVMDVSVFKKKQQSTKSKALNKKTMPMMQAAMQAIVEDENEDAQTATTATSSSSSTTEIERLKEISTLARLQATFEIEARGLPKEEKEKMEKARIDRLRFLAKEQLQMHRSSKRISATSILSIKSINEDPHHE